MPQVIPMVIGAAAQFAFGSALITAAACFLTPAFPVPRTPRHPAEGDLQEQPRQDTSVAAEESSP